MKNKNKRRKIKYFLKQKDKYFVGGAKANHRHKAREYQEIGGSRIRQIILLLDPK